MRANCSGRICPLNPVPARKLQFLIAAQVISHSEVHEFAANTTALAFPINRPAFGPMRSVDHSDLPNIDVRSDLSSFQIDRYVPMATRTWLYMTVARSIFDRPLRHC